MNLHDTLAPRHLYLPSDRDKELFGTNTAFFIFAVLAVALRFLAARYRTAEYGPEDFLCLGALVAYAAVIGCHYQMILGSPIPHGSNTPQNIHNWQQMKAAVRIPFSFSMGLARASIIVFQMRLFWANRKFVHITWAILAFDVAWVLTLFISALTICQPLSRNFDPTEPGTCGNLDASYMSIISLGIVLDVTIFTAPLFVIWKLQMTVARRLGITLLFAIGLFDVIAGAMRLVTSIQESKDGNQAPFLIWSIIEPSVAIFVASAPHYRVMYKHVTTRLSGYRDSSPAESVGQRSKSGASNTLHERRASSIDQLYGKLGPDLENEMHPV